ncbi:hypothetical protein NG799_16105 [Laspinema sp. D1]|uniref:Uncharacterized protein n=1 Tax=Laspinema palackyanum D2a TaxID=2953684 RepID=A0ABT2MSY9_9CYAN|nr:hypothetical protein [Laspinema sp. D2b]MCT7967864.1 hypothetical protein [Laspinema sp. D2a]
MIRAIANLLISTGSSLKGQLKHYGSHSRHTIRLFGNSGFDTFYLEWGADTLTGCQNKDTFILFPTLGGGTLAEASVITDFSPLEDELELPGGVTFEGLNIFQGIRGYTFTRTDSVNVPLSSPLTVNFIGEGDATLNTHYNPTGADTFGTTGTVTFAGGSDTAIVSIAPISDRTLEEDEKVALT